MKSERTKHGEVMSTGVRFPLRKKILSSALDRPIKDGGIFSLSPMTALLLLHNEHLINPNKQLKVKLRLADQQSASPT